MARPPADPARRRERAHRVLDAAAGLILRWGYDKTTIEDVARAAGVAKGTIYLHWKTRELLFATLLRRERVESLHEVRQAAPRTLHDLVRLMATELQRRPLMRAALLGDSGVLGRLARIKSARAPDPLQIDGLERFFADLVKHGAVRADLTVAEHVSVLTSALFGFLTAERLTPYRLPPDRTAELLADTVHRTLEAGGDLTGEAADAVAGAVTGYVEHALALAESKLDAALEGHLE
ncbi:TetR/AcrR family transcriptional regulator [Nonomuraea typhae]|uniref:TetR/AcrR family transcriptional regulator n=1 Tax=Nonomuraea typhae TaxID=2603600 RepID=A0ABW7YRB4_9ACTN